MSHQLVLMLSILALAGGTLLMTQPAQASPPTQDRAVTVPVDREGHGGRGGEGWRDDRGRRGDDGWRGYRGGYPYRYHDDVSMTLVQPADRDDHGWRGGEGWRDGRGWRGYPDGYPYRHRDDVSMPLVQPADRGDNRDARPERHDGDRNWDRDHSRDRHGWYRDRDNRFYDNDRCYMKRIVVYESVCHEGYCTQVPVVTYRRVCEPQGFGFHFGW